MSTPEPGPREEGHIAGATRLFQRHIAVVVLLTVLGVVVGGAYALTRPPTYQAESRLLVGTFEAPSTAMPGYVLASQTVAGDYARVAATSAVLEPLAQELGVTIDHLRSAVTVTAIPQSAVLRIVATSSDAEEARLYAESMANTIERTVEQLNNETNAEQILTDYQEAATELAAANTVLDAAQQNLDALLAASPTATAAITEARNAVQAADVQRATIEVRADGLADRYIRDQERASTSSQVRVLGGASVTEASNLVDTLTFLVVLGVAGALIGLAVAWRRDSRVAADGHGRAGHRPVATTAPHDQGPPRPTSDDAVQGDDDDGDTAGATRTGATR